MPIPFPSFPITLTNYKILKSLLNLTYNGDIIMTISKMDTNEKLPSLPTKVSWNPLSCSSVSPTPLQLLWSHPLGLHFNGLSQFFSFLYLIWSFQTSNHEEILQRNSLISCPYHSTNTCLPYGEPCLIKLNCILDSSFLCCAWLCCHTHALPSCYASSSILPLPCGCIMLLISAMPTLDSISRFNTNMYILYASI